MKKNIFLKGLAGVLVASAIMPAMTSCKSDYLELAPITEISKADVQKSLEEALYAMQGTCSSMYMQVTSDYGGWNNTCNAPFMAMMYGEALGNTYHDAIWHQNGNTVTKWTQMRNKNGMTARMQWQYCYGLINSANLVLDGIDELPTADSSDEAKRDFIKAVLLTIRAYANLTLLQTYGPRWQDSNNGAAISGVVLRTASEPIEVPFATTGEMITQIYADLDNAIAAFRGSSYKDNLIWTPDENVAHGIKARAASVKLDWQTCRDEAKIGRQGHAIMTAEQYEKGGFITANQEYLWATWFQSEGMYYYSHGGTYSCNGWTVWSWGQSCGIDFDLYKQIPMTDVRKGMYIAPGFFQLAKADIVNEGFVEDEWGEKKITDDVFYDPKVVSSTMSMRGNPDESFADFVSYYAMCDEFWPDNTTGMPFSGAYGDAFPYYDADYMVTGLQYKFWSVDVFGTNQFPYMRASELAYLEAEAACMLGDDTGAQAIMVELNKDVRDPDFTCTETGQALLEKIRTYRHIELWGEGFTWFDLKRWNVPMVRNKWVANDPTSGNWRENLAGTYQPSENSGWRVSVPINEFNYNKAVHEEDLPNGNM